MPFANTALSTATTVSLLASAPWSALAQKGNSFKIVGDGKVSGQSLCRV